MNLKSFSVNITEQLKSFFHSRLTHRKIIDNILYNNKAVVISYR